MHNQHFPPSCAREYQTDLNSTSHVVRVGRYATAYANHLAKTQECREKFGRDTDSGSILPVSALLHLQGHTQEERDIVSAFCNESFMCSVLQTGTIEHDDSFLYKSQT